MRSRRPVSAKTGNRARIPHCAHDWHSDEPTFGIFTGGVNRAERKSLDRHPHHLPTDIGLPSNRQTKIEIQAGVERAAAFGWDPLPAGTRRQYEPVTSPTPVELAAALQELSKVGEAVAEDGLEMPSEAAFANARRLLEAMYRISPRRFDVYPEPGGYITIDARGANNGIAVVMCDSDSGVLCVVIIDDEPRRARYSTARKLPDGFIRDALLELGADPA